MSGRDAGRAVNIGIIGAGLMGREIAAAIQRWPALIDHPVRPRLTAVCDINPDAMRWFEQIDSVRGTFTDHREMLASGDVDVVYVAVRHDLHEALYVDVIEAGKGLLAEKPFGIDGRAAASIIRAAERHPESFVRCSSEMPFFPGAQWAADYVRSGALGRIIEARSAFLHSSDLDVDKPINWKRQSAFCGESGVMNDLGLHAWHVPLRLGWEPRSVYGVLQDIVPFRPGSDGAPVVCDTWDNATLHVEASADGAGFPLSVEMKRIAPGHKNSWEFEAIGMEGGVRFSTKSPKLVEVFDTVRIPGVGPEQSWQRIDAGSRSVWPTVTGANFETGFSDSILQMWAAYLAEREGVLDGRFGCATPAEAARAHTLNEAALESHRLGSAVGV